MSEKRTVLLLQGPSSTFWSQLADAFEAAGHRVHHVNLSLGDLLFWRRRGALNYRGRFEDWEDWLDRLIAREGVTDILYFADRLPYHVAAQKIAARRGLRTWAVEYGYLRPDWLTLEPIAMGRRSRFTRDPAEIRRLAEGAPPLDMTPRYGAPFSLEAFCEVVFNLGHVFGRGLYPFYRSDKVYWPVIEYLGWLAHFAKEKSELRQAREVEEQCISGDHPFFLIALQLESDYQLRASSDYSSQTEMLEELFASFSANAPGDVRLVVKVHPFDPNLTNWPKTVGEIAARHGMADRIVTIRGGNLRVMLDHARGMVSVNSTSGIQSFQAGCPVLAMGDAIYDMTGLTHQGPVDAFWTAPEAPDPDLVDCWCRAVAEKIQVRGSVYNREGRALAAAEIVRRIGEAGRYFQLYRDMPAP